jgi:large subunit ribosomal protein LP0
METNPEIEKFLPCVRGNCGFVFTNEDVKEIRDVVLGNRVQSIARPGVIAPNDVVVPPGPTGLDPGQTSFFQALNIATKIFKGQIEITSKVFIVPVEDVVRLTVMMKLSDHR